MRNMRRSVILLFLSLPLAFLACGGSDDDEVVQPVSGDTVQVVPPQPSLPLPIVKNYSEEEFLNLFVGGLWVESTIYDVYEDGHLGEEIFHRVVGASHIYLKPLNNDSARFHLPVEDPGRPDIDRTVAYHYSEGNQFQIWDTEDIRYNNPMTVLEIKTDSMRLLGPVYSTQWAPEAVAGLYVYRRLSEESANRLEERWERGEKW